MRDLASNIGAVAALASAVQSAAVNGAAIDTLGFGSVAFILSTGAIVSDGDFGAKVQESDNGADFTDADAGFVDSTAPATLGATSVYKLGYRGHKRFVRLAITKAGGTSIAAGAIAILGDAAQRPVA